MAKFEKGKSGNPAGRPKGSLNPQARIRHAIAADLPSILATLRDRALAGDVQSATVLLSRCLPPLKPVSEGPDTPLAGTDLAQRAESIASATMAGELAPSAAAELMSVLTAQARITEIGELSERIERVESALKLGKTSK